MHINHQEMCNTDRVPSYTKGKAALQPQCNKNYSFNLYATKLQV